MPLKLVLMPRRIASREPRISCASASRWVCVNTVLRPPTPRPCAAVICLIMSVSAESATVRRDSTESFCLTYWSSTPISVCCVIDDAIALGLSEAACINLPDDIWRVRSASRAAAMLTSRRPLRKVWLNVTRMENSPSYRYRLPAQIHQHVECRIDHREVARVGFVGALEAHHRRRFLVE